MLRKFGSDLAVIEPGVKAENDGSITFSAVIAREIMHKHPEGMAYVRAGSPEACRLPPLLGHSVHRGEMKN
jgi:hypothetical protein